MSNGFLRITLRRSPIGFEKSQGKTAVALGLRKMNHTVIQPDNPQIRGMIHKISHMLEVEPVAAEVASAPAVETAPAAEEAKPRRRTAKKAEEAEQEEAK